MSSKRRRRDAVYPQRRIEVFERAGGMCERCLIAPCEQVHHRAGRGGHDPHALSNLIGLCAACHRWAHAHPADAVIEGVSRSRHRSTNVSNRWTSG
jgi:5-methylcytosine-specific restriction endonuclease McrA